MAMHQYEWYVLLQLDCFRDFLPPTLLHALDAAYGDIAPATMSISPIDSSDHLARWKSWKLDQSKLDALTQTDSNGKEALQRAVSTFEKVHGERLDTHFFACGKRGVLFAGTSATHLPVVIKVQKLNEHNPIDRESLWLRRVNRFRIGPTLHLSGPGFFACELLDDGVHAVDFLRHPAATHADVHWFLRRIFHQCFVLDALRINKAEMTHPMRHIIVHGSARCVLIDFEKCVFSHASPRNVTQLTQFISSPRVVAALAAKGIALSVPGLRTLAQQYKRAPSAATFAPLLHHILQ
ncbi:Aste57867_16909 [Aphanomyces stellatus]|uniref:Aste57867_16909 protein n=1 Tax=Aphanomyces stellatus TaxID=120398 RepID=A0A485L6V6_9STRA|nr:hypothetical protein As57867_016851 [Aphanomyces stellatus]VFT93672.1 Aste57867_16909 [Aphanomyces stellatus]